MPDTEYYLQSVDLDPGRIESLERARTTSVGLLVLRMAVVFAVLGVALYSLAQSGGEWGSSSKARLLFGVILTASVLNVVYLWLQRQTKAYETIALLQILGDVALTSVVVYLTDGVLSPFVSFYFASIMAAALSLRRGLALVTASSTTIGLSAAVLAKSVLGTAELTGNDFSFLLAQACAFFLVALLSGHLSTRLATSRLLSREILQAIGQGILVSDASGNVVFCNQEALRLLALPEPPLGQPLEKILSEMTLSGQAPWGGEIHRSEVEMATRDGRTVPVRIVSFPVNEGRFRMRGEIVVLTDRSTERRMEQAMRQVERAKVLGEMAASIAHELRNPLSSIRGSVQEISRIQGIPEDKRMLLDIVIEESDRLDRIITDFLDFARMRSVRKVHGNLGDMVLEIQMLLENHRRETHPEGNWPAIDIRVPEGGVPAHMDAEQMRQVILNLGINALAVLDEKGTLTISVSQGTYGEYTERCGVPARGIARIHPGVLVEVADDGPGMDASTRERVFDPFFTTKPRGSGLGLAVAHRVVMSHGGVIHVNTEPGAGAAFRIWLPDAEFANGQSSSR